MRRAERSSPWPYTSLIAAALSGAALLWIAIYWAGTIAGAVQYLESPGIDFTFLWQSARESRNGLSAYDSFSTHTGQAGQAVAHPNLNHPALVAILLPLTWVPVMTAFIVWTCLSLGALLLALRMVHRHLPTHSGRRVRRNVTLAVLGLPGVLHCVAVGQVALLMTPFLLVVAALLRNAQWRRAGFALGVLIALKPFLLPTLAVFLARGRRRGLLHAAAGSVVISAAAVPFVGFAAYRQWLHVLSSVHWQAHPLNISVPGMLHRTVSELPEWGTWAPAVVLAAAGLGLALRESERDGVLADALFAALVVISLLSSPLTWVYYTTFALTALHPVIERLVARGRTAQVLYGGGLALIWVPHIASLNPRITSSALDILPLAPTAGMIVLLLLLSRFPPECRLPSHPIRRAAG